MASFKQRDKQAEILAHLRALAQHHLSEIEVEKAQEQTQQSQADAEIQRYAKISALERRQQTYSSLKPGLEQREQQPHRSLETEIPATSDMGVNPKKDRFRPFNEILHRIKWDPDLEINDYTVGYLERFEGIKEMAASSWIRDFSDEEWIPMHRVRYVKRVRISQSRDQDRGPALGMVWDRDSRVDRISKPSGIEQDDHDVFSVDGTSVTGGMSL